MLVTAGFRLADLRRSQAMLRRHPAGVNGSGPS
jgi:hypothetical protein